MLDDETVNGLGTLTKSDGFSSRTFTLNGNEKNLNGSKNAGITISSGDTFYLNNITMKDFTTDITNQGTTNFRTWKTENTCLVFGASTEGNGETAAFNARRYGAKPKTAGPFTHSYGIHTKEQTLEQVTENVKEFLEYYNEHPEKTYLITTVGTSGAGFEIKQIAPLFKELADKKNVYLPEPYRKYLEEHE